MKYKNNKQNKYKNLSCPNCDSEEIIKRGFRYTDNRGKIQRFSCNYCHHRFVDNNSFYRMRNNDRKISLCLDLFYRGLSTREIQSHLQAFYPHNSSNVSIYKWIKKYILKIANYTDNLKINTGSYIEVDEMEYHRRKSHKKKLGVDKNWLINGIDVKTRFLISSSYFKYRSQNNIKEVLSKVKNKTGNQIKIVTTDGYTAYEKAVKRTFGYDNHLGKYNVKHNVVTQRKGEGFNIWVERLHNTIRQRTQNFRGLHGSVESAYALMKGIEIYYNFVKKHEALKGKTPSELAIPSLKFQTTNRWLELINLANKSI
ncbi:MAG: DDE-type integrase/transposase/recombinase [Candidatus Pacearchaeota archaeon]